MANILNIYDVNLTTDNSIILVTCRTCYIIESSVSVILICSPYIIARYRK